MPPLIESSTDQTAGAPAPADPEGVAALPAPSEATEATEATEAKPTDPAFDWDVAGVLAGLSVKASEIATARAQPGSILVPLLWPIVADALSEDPEVGEELHRRAEAMGDWGHPRGPDTEPEAEQWTAVGAFVLEYQEAVHRLFPPALAFARVELDVGTLAAARARRYAEWLKQKPDLVVAVLVAHGLIADARQNPADLFLAPKKDAKTIALALAAYVKELHGAGTWLSWDQALRLASEAWWWRGGSRALTAELARECGRLLAQRATSDQERLVMEKELAAARRRLEKGDAVAERTTTERLAEVSGLREELAAARRQLAELTRESAELRHGRDRHRARAEALAEEMRRHGLEPGATQEEEAEPAPAPAAPEPVAAAPAEPELPPVPADVFAGRKVLLFTAHERGIARQDMARAFEQFGADVEVIHSRESAKGPERYKPETIVVLEVRFMPHKTSTVLKERAKASGCWVIELRHGSNLAAEVAQRWWKDRHLNVR
ncbi:MAG: hypothetical protein NW201_14000 [Gemmatimonadales bacterium]|nr:hypothetical protein [Gemmatimonadales bacterium]